MTYKTLIPFILVMNFFGSSSQAGVTDTEVLQQLTDECSAIVQSSSAHHVNTEENYVWCQSENGYGFSLPLGIS